MAKKKKALLERNLEDYPRWAIPSQEYEAGDWRSVEKHDVDEIVYLHSYRKLAQKPQVIVQPLDDTFRTRLTHTLEVAQIADNFSDRLKLNDDLTRAIASGHDLGHPPFAHVGERTLNRLLRTFVSRTAIGLGAEEEIAENIYNSFGFKHHHNSRRILQRKTKRLSDITLKAVVGHSWSPWKNCSTKTSLKNIEEYLLTPLTDETRYGNIANYLSGYEAQAVALSDQIAALNSDVEDLVLLDGSPKNIRSAVFDIFGRLRITDLDMRELERVIKRCIEQTGSPEDRKRGWGRKHRLGQAVGSIIEYSKDRISNLYRKHPDFNFTASVNYPLSPSPIIAVALDILEKATRRLIFTHPTIRERDALAEAATTIMFSRLLSLEAKSAFPSRNSNSENFTKRINDDYEKWKSDYELEVKKETEEVGVISFPAMQRSAEKIRDLWELVHPAVLIVDYVSEMTDRFVIHDVFADDSLQEALLENFERRPLSG